MKKRLLLFLFLATGLVNAQDYLSGKIQNSKTNIIPKKQRSEIWGFVTKTISWLATYLFVCFAWIFFRAESVTQALQYITKICSISLFTTPFINANTLIIMFCIIFFFSIEWLGRESKFAIQNIPLKMPTPVRWAFYYSLAILILLFYGEGQQFIYFQF